MLQQYDNDQLDAMIRTTVKVMKQASAHQVWTWVGNREGNLLEIEHRMRELAKAGMLVYIGNSAPAAYRFGKWR